jgi:hypothetical protein
VVQAGLSGGRPIPVRRAIYHKAPPPLFHAGYAREFAGARNERASRQPLRPARSRVTANKFANLNIVGIFVGISTFHIGLSFWKITSNFNKVAATTPATQSGLPQQRCEPGKDPRHAHS